MKKVLIANRGEIACRVIRSCRALGLRTVAVYSDVDVGSMHAMQADESVKIGGSTPLESYLRADRVLDAAHSSGADAIHPGYGFLAENDGFARAVEAAGMIWVGPTPESMIEMGDKERARLLAKAAGVPVLPGSIRFGPEDTSELAKAGDFVGYPLLVKATAGGGGIGMRRVDRSEDLVAAVQATQGMALRAFGDATIYLERLIMRARHIEVQVFGLGDGNAFHVNERDCSIQRRYQKIIEESPAPNLPLEVKNAMFAASVSLCRQQRYRGAGTVEFVVDADSLAFYFLEMNTRIQVEHPVSEMNTGLDLVAMQLQLAAGMPLGVHAQEDVVAKGHSIECRLYAERPAKGFLPSTGTLSRLALPVDDATLRVDLGVRQGDKVTHLYDPMLAKLITHGEDRAQALARMLEALDEVQIEGVETNLAFLRKTVNHPAFREGAVSTDFVNAHKAELLG